MDFGLICEGPTDQAVIENVLCGIYDNEDLFEEITPLQPGGVSDTNKDGGWERVLEYIASYKFREAFSFIDNIIIQIDTDVATNIGFDIDFRDQNGITTKSIPIIIDKVKERLIEKINSIEDGFYDKHKDRIFFAISVHSIETWIYKHYDNQSRKSQINNGEENLAKQLNKNKKYNKYIEKGSKNSLLMKKNYDNYNELTISFFNTKTAKKSINSLYVKDESFKIFIDSLPPL